MHESGRTSKTLKDYCLLCVYCAVIAYAALSALRKPAYNWDMLPYMGVVLSYNGEPALDAVHLQVYAIAKEEVPQLFYQRMVDSSNPYRSSVAKNAAVFGSQMPFYVVKPLYTRLAYWFYKMGSKLPAATVWPSAISYLFTGLLFFHWCKKYWSVVYAFAGSCFVMLSPPLLTAAGLSTPDALSGFLLFYAVYLVTETVAVGTACMFLVLSVFARLDNILPAAAILVAVYFANDRRFKLAGSKVVFIALLLLLAYFFVAANARAYGWSILYYPAFAKQLNTSYNANASFSFSGYAALVKSQLTTGFYFSFLSVFLFLAMLYLWDTAFKLKKLTAEQLLTILFVLVIIIRFVLQPLITDRIYIPYYLSVFAFLVKKNSRLQHSGYHAYEKVIV